MSLDIVDEYSQEQASGARAAPGKNLGRTLRIAVAVLLLLVIIQFVDLRAVLQMLGRADLRFLAPLLGIALLDRYLMAYKWAILMRARGHAFTNAEAFRIYLSAGFVGMVLPTGVGSDVYRAIRTTMGGRDSRNVAASIVVERGIGLLAIAILSLVGLAIYSRQYPQIRGFYYGVWVVFIVIVVVFALSIHPQTFAIVERMLRPFERYRLVRFYLGFHGAYLELCQQWRALLLFGLLSLVEQSVSSFMNYLGAVALGLPVPLITFLALMPLSNFVVLLPISIGAIGVEEGVFIVLLGLAGLTPTQSLSLALLMRVVGWLMLIPGGLAFLYDSARFKRAGRTGEP